MNCFISSFRNRCWLPMWVIKVLSRKCPCPEFVQCMSRVCLVYVQNMSLSNFCLDNVHFLSNKCPPVRKMSVHCPHRFQFLSTVRPNFSLFLKGQIRDNFCNCIFPFNHLETLQLDKSWTNLGHRLLTLYAFSDEDKI